MKASWNQLTAQHSKHAAPDPTTRFKLTPNKKEREAAGAGMSRPIRQCLVAEATSFSRSNKKPHSTSRTSRSTSLSPLNPSNVVKPTARTLRPDAGTSRDRSRPIAAYKPREPAQKKPSIPEVASRLQEKSVFKLTDEQILKLTKHLSINQTASRWHSSERFVSCRLSGTIRTRAQTLGMDPAELKAAHNKERFANGAMNKLNGTCLSKPRK